jgi:diaminopimelate epimerase
MQIEFTKIHASGNDFIFTQLPENQLNQETIKHLSHRNFGIGCDQFINIYNFDDKNNIINVEIFNQDGSIAKMCINAMRAITNFINPETKFTVSVKHGKSVDIEKNNNNIASVEIFGIFQENELINVGNLHKIFIINNESEIDRNTSDLYNKNYVQIIAQDRLKITTIERGSGETLACGSGICASVFYCNRNKLTTSNTIQIETKGTKLMNDEFSIQDEITVQIKENILVLNGSYKLIFKGIIDI